MRPPGSPEELERRRRRAVALLAAGHRPVEVARMIGVDRRSVRRWKAVHHHQGPEALRARRAVAARGVPNRRVRELATESRCGARYHCR